MFRTAPDDAPVCKALLNWSRLFSQVEITPETAQKIIVRKEVHRKFLEMKLGKTKPPEFNEWYLKKLINDKKYDYNPPADMSKLTDEQLREAEFLAKDLDGIFASVPKWLGKAEAMNE